MILRDTDYTLDFPKESIKLFEERILASGLCDVIVPMSFQTGKNVKSVTYDCSGYASVRDLEPKNIREIYEILEKTLITLSKSTEFLISPEKITLNIDCVFYNLRSRRVRIAYIPSERGTVWEHIYGFAMELMNMAEEEAKNYLSELLEEGRLNNYNIRDMAKIVREQKRILFAKKN